MQKGGVRNGAPAEWLALPIKLEIPPTPRLVPAVPAWDELLLFALRGGACVQEPAAATPARRVNVSPEAAGFVMQYRGKSLK